MKKKRQRRVSVPSTALLGKHCNGVDAMIAVWPTNDGLNGRAATRADTVHVVAFSDYDIKGYNGGTALLSKTTIRDMVRREVESGVRCDTGKLDKRYARRFGQLRDALMEAAKHIEDSMPNTRITDSGKD